MKLGADFKDVIGAMPKEARRMMGEPALEKEIVFYDEENGLADSGAGGRIVSWTCARVRHRFDKDVFLVVLGSVEDGHVTATCRLPETHRIGTDDMGDSLRDLSQLSPGLTTSSVSCLGDTGWQGGRHRRVKSKNRRQMFELMYDGICRLSAS